VNAIAPGPTDTEATRSIVPQQYLKAMLAQMPLAASDARRPRRPMSLPALRRAAWMTGQVLNVDGGQIMRP
jgi:NAD(P)-dependent dehydrogenase (short-subunit alcohol dehydrogenase family)